MHNIEALHEVGGSATHQIQAHQSATARWADRVVAVERIHPFTGEHQSDGAEAPSAIALSGGRVLEVGSLETLAPLIGPETNVEQYAGAVMTPGLTDAHTHIVFGLELTRGVQLTDMTLEQVREALAEEAARTGEGDWVFGWGVDPNIFAEHGFSGRIFDPFTGEKPMFLRMRDAHSALTNTMGLEIAGITGSEKFDDESVIGLDSSGKPSGYLVEFSAMDLVLQHIAPESVEQLAQRLALVLDGMARSGLTGTHVMDFHDGSQEVLEYLEARQELPVRLRFSPLIPPTVTSSGLLEYERLQGLSGRRWSVEGVKFMIDGTVDNGSAWLIEPDCYGESVKSIWTDPAAYRRALRFFAERGIPTATHAIGDRGVEFVLDAIESLGETARLAAHRIEHIETIPDELVGRFAALGVSASMQPIHGTRHTLADRSDNWSVRLGDARAARGWRCADLRRSGATVALGSDWPVTPYDPRVMMAESILRAPVAKPEALPIQPEQALTNEQALEGYTTHAARAIGSTDEGSLRVGARASFTIFAQDPLTLEATELAEMPVRATYVDGVKTLPGIV